jgi:galactokinase
MKPVFARRARHVLTENQRVQAGFELLRRSGDLHAFGQLMLESHQSSRDNFENSSPELDCLVEIARSLPGFRGAKLSGAGWGGCTVNLVHAAQAELFSRRLVEEFSGRVGLPASVLLCNPAEGAHVVRV